LGEVQTSPPDPTKYTLGVGRIPAGLDGGGQLLCFFVIFSPFSFYFLKIAILFIKSVKGDEVCPFGFPFIFLLVFASRKFGERVGKDMQKTAIPPKSLPAFWAIACSG